VSINGRLLAPVAAEINDLGIAAATYKAACERWPDRSITLRQGGRVIADTRWTRPEE